MKILWLMSDSLEEPAGGMGEQAKRVLERINCRIDIIGPSRQKKTNYGKSKVFYPLKSLNIPMGAIDPALAGLLSQADIVSTALELKKPDIIHAFDWSNIYAGIILSKKWNVPLITGFHLAVTACPVAPLPEEIAIVNLLKTIELMALIESKKILYVSNAYQNVFPQFFKSKGIVVPNGIDLTLWKKKRKRFNFPGKNKIKVVYIGRFAYQKGVHHLLEAKIPKNIDLIYIGSSKASNTELFDVLAYKTKKEKNIFYIGSLYGEEKMSALQSADAIIMPSIHEPFGIVALEALASRSILISSFADGLGEFLTEDIAIKCEVSPLSITKTLKQFVNMPEDEREKRIKKGVNLCKKFNWDKIVDKIERIYKEVINEQTVRPSI